MHTNKADIIIAGGGLAGLTLAVECAQNPFFAGKTILIIDRDDKTRNDRTWCFWATDQENIPPVVGHSWKHCHFFGTDFDKQLDVDPFQYHMIRGIDFYNWAKSVIAQHSNIQWLKADIASIDAGAGMVHTSAGDFSGDWVFNSAKREQIDLPSSDTRYTQLLQHFKGWVLKTEKPVFDPGTMTFMDYRIEQHGETRFVYVLPFSPTEALVEFTVFSPALLSPDDYDEALKSYLHHQLAVEEYTITDTEFGVIPMANVPLTSQEGRVLNIGTAGGFVKGSSGYAFKRTQRKLQAFVADWAEKGVPDPSLLRSTWRYRFYDSVMLRVLEQNAVPGSEFFSGLFKKLPAQLVFRFLDEDSTFAEDFRLMSVPPTWPFFKTALQQFPIFSKI